MPGDGPGDHFEVFVRHDSSLQQEGFRIRTDRSGAHLDVRDERGLAYAQNALAQLKSSRSFAAARVLLEDWPDFAIRGFMLDVSRDRVPTRRFLLRLIDLLAIARFNQLELYMEHSFAYADHQTVWRDASPLTPADVQWLDGQCASRGIDLVPNQNTFAHMERWLKHSGYRDRAENPDGFPWEGKHHVPTTLAPTPENIDLVGDLLSELAPNFRTRRINIGADELAELELGGVTSAAVESHGAGSVFMDYVQRVMEPWITQGYRVEFWADSFAEHPELMGRAPAEAAPLVWQYESPSREREIAARLGRDCAAPEPPASGGEEEYGFVRRARTLIDAQLPFWVAAGTSTWMSFTGRVDNAVENMIDAALVGRMHAAEGYLITCWGDLGSFDPPSMWFGPLMFGGAVSWNVEANQSADLVGILNDHVLHDPSGVLGRVLFDIGLADKALGSPIPNASQLFSVLQRAGDLDPGTWPQEDGIARADAVLSAAFDALDSAQPAAPDGDLIVDEVRHAIRFARFGAEILRRGPSGVEQLESAPARALLSRLDALLAEHARLWVLRSRRGGLENTVQVLGDLRAALESRSIARDVSGAFPS